MRNPQLKLILSFAAKLSSTKVGTRLVNRLPKGGTAPGIHPEYSKTSSGVANLIFLHLINFLNSLELNLWLAETTAK